MYQLILNVLYCTILWLVPGSGSVGHIIFVFNQSQDGNLVPYSPRHINGENRRFSYLFCKHEQLILIDVDV